MGVHSKFSEQLAPADRNEAARGETRLHAEQVRLSGARAVGWFRSSRATIAGRVRIFAGFFTLLLVFLGAVLTILFAELTARTDESEVFSTRASAASKSAKLLAESRYHASQFAHSGEKADITAAFHGVEQAKRDLAATLDLETEEVVSREKVAWLAAQIEGFEPELRALETSVAINGPGVANDPLVGAIAISGSLLSQIAGEVEEELSVEANEARKSLDLLQRWAALLAALTIMGCIAMAVLGARGLSREVSTSLGAITDAMTDLAAGDRSIAIPGVERQDEVGAMSRALVVFRRSAEKLADMQARARADQAALIRNVAGRFETGMGDVVTNVATASDQLRDTASLLSHSATQTSDCVDEVSQTMSETSLGVTAAAATTDQFAMSIAEIGRQSASSAGLARDARAASENAEARLAELTDAAQQIGSIVELIGSIADHTNLLALNASIEAARGGEAGRGFAVVASEVKALARQTTAATQQVAEHIAGMQRSTRRSADALGQIVDRVRNVEMTATAIAQAVDEQTVSSRALARNLDVAATGVLDIGQGIERIRAMAGDTGTAAHQVLAAATGLRREARTLGDASSEFTNTVLAA